MYMSRHFNTWLYCGRLTTTATLLSISNSKIQVKLSPSRMTVQLSQQFLIAEARCSLKSTLLSAPQGKAYLISKPNKDNEEDPWKICEPLPSADDTIGGLCKDEISKCCGSLLLLSSSADSRSRLWLGSPLPVFAPSLADLSSVSSSWSFWRYFSDTMIFFSPSTYTHDALDRSQFEHFSPPSQRICRFLHRSQLKSPLARTHPLMNTPSDPYATFVRAAWAFLDDEDGINWET